MATVSRPLIPVVRSVADLREWIATRRAEGERIALVPTMGALHEGHLSLVTRAQQDDHLVVISIFVNPTQFGPGEDFDSYPRDEEADVALAAEVGARLVFAPTPPDMYPDGFSTTISVSGVTEPLEGAARPEHFDGVATVVAKLLLAVRPDRVVFGAKDAQQVAVIRRMMRDLHLDDTELVEAPTIREDGGLAMSSRNRYLNTQERAGSLAISRGLSAAVSLAESGETSAERLVAAVRESLEAEPTCETEYVALVDGETFAPVAALDDRAARLCVAARVGPARLIDNASVTANAR